jgi:hypothetical protein
MDSQIVQRTRYQLQVRVRTAKTCPTAVFPNACRHLVNWVEAHPFLRRLLDPIRQRIEAFSKRIEEAVEESKERHNDVKGPWSPETREEGAAFGWATLEAISKQDLSEKLAPDAARLLAYIVAAYAPRGGSESSDVVEHLRDVALQAVYDYLDEEIDARNAVLGLLLKYKTRCEWFRRERLRGAAAGGLEGRTGERALAFDLYEYLHDQGVDYAIESVTAMGEPDLVASDVGGQCLVADAKYVDEDDKLVPTLAGGFRQVAAYCRDKNEPVGYLVAFLDCGVTPEIMGDRDDGFHCFRLGNVTVYYVVVDIRPRTTTASKLPKPRVVEITRERLVTLVETAADVPT